MIARTVNLDELATDVQELAQRRIKAARTQLGWSRQRLAAEIGSSARAVEFWEKHERRITLRELTKIAHVTGRTIAWFVGEELV